MAERPIFRKDTVVYCTFPINNCRRTRLGLREIGKVTEQNFASLLKKHFIALRCEHQTMKRKNSLRKTSFYLLSFFIGERAQGRKIKSVINTIRQEQYW